MKKNAKKVLLGALSCALGLTVWTGAQVNTQTAAAAGETYTLKFVDTGYIETLTSVNVNGNGSGSLVEDEAISGKAVKVVANDTSAYPYFRVFDGNTVTAGDTYHIRLKVKGNGMKFHLWQNLAGYELIDDWVATTSEWVEYNYDYTVKNTATENVMLFCQVVSVPEGGGCFYIEDLSVEKTMSVTNGSAIGALPSLEAGKAWTIDGELITADTVYNYTEDKLATTQSVDTLTFAYPDMIEGMAAGDFGAVYNATAEILETDTDIGKALKFTTGTANTAAPASPWICLSSSTIPAGEYVVKFKMLNSKYVNVQYQIGSYDYSATTILQANVSNQAVWTDYEYTIRLESEASSLYLLLNAHPGAGEIYVDDLTLTLKANTIKYVFAGKEIGTLPALGEDLYWAIDGKKVTADTVWTYEGSKTATVEQVKYLSFDSVCGDLIDDVFTETWVGNAVNNGMATIVGEENKQVEVCLTDTNDAGRIFLSQTVLTPDDVYTLKFKMKGDGSKVHLYFMPGDTLMDDWVTTTPDWTEYTYTVAVKAEDGGQLWVKAASVVSADSKVYLDDISFEKPIERMVVEKDETIGSLPTVPEKEHYVGAWAIDGEVINVDTVWTYDVSKTAKLVYTANTYTVTFVNGDEVVSTQTYTVENTEITVPEVSAKEHYTGVWESYELNGGDKTINAVYTAIEYTVTFVNGDEVVSTQTYTVENTEITAPEVPAKEGYTGVWAEYELNGGNKTVEVVYTAVEEPIDPPTSEPDEPPTSEPDEPTSSEPDEPTTSEPTTSDEPLSEPVEEEGGCGSVIGGVSAALALVAAAAVVLKKKED